MNNGNHQGIGMTSQRTRDRLITRLEEKRYTATCTSIGELCAVTPRHLFVDEALACAVELMKIRLYPLVINKLFHNPMLLHE